MKRYLSLIVALSIIDRLIKISTIFFLITFVPAREIKILGNFFVWSFYANKNLAFSLPYGNQKIIIFVTCLIILFLFYLLYKDLKKQKTNRVLAEILIILGAFSNLFDRLNYGYVIDYFQLAGISYFNLADLLIGAGLIWLIFNLKNGQQNNKSLST